MPEPELDERWILVFDSIHHVLAAERALLARQVRCDLIPTPRDVSSDCGMVIELRPTDWTEARGVIRALVTPPRATYRRIDRGEGKAAILLLSDTTAATPDPSPAVPLDAQTR
ncbi:MAG: DUF3343 domain-containing protein [Candidatus Anammoximicrobium sp.]|nr:DUF3343 domain-containing protein [Candidatus Anammoximicrobium sp.]